MNKNMMIGGVVVLAVVAISAVYLVNKSDTSKTQVTQSTNGKKVFDTDMPQTSITPPMEKPTGVIEKAVIRSPITLEEIAKHSKAEDCWMAIEGKVYDTTPYIQKQIHPGGAAILFGCGKDSTAIFNLRPKDNKPHSQKARGYLENYYIGELAK